MKMFRSVARWLRRIAHSPYALPAEAKLCHFFSGAAGVAAVALIFPNNGSPSWWAIGKAAGLLVVCAIMLGVSILLQDKGDDDHE